MFRHGCKTRDSYFTVFAKPSVTGHARLGLAVSRRTAPTAVARNRIKRQTRESFRRQQALLAGLDVVVVAQPAARTAAPAALRAALEQHWLKVTRKCKEC